MTNTKLIKSRTQMQKFAATMARKGDRVIALQGELGAGKTTFAQGFLKALGVKGPIVSPTFLIIRNYSNFYHIDCYRLKKAQELLALGLKEILANPENIVLIEWPELVKKYLPKDTCWITIKHGEKKTERIVSYSSFRKGGGA